MPQGLKSSLARSAVMARISRLGVGELLAAAAIAAFLDERRRRVEIDARRGPGVFFGPAFHEAEQPRAMKMDVGQKKLHRPALGDLGSLIEVVARAAEIASRGVK